MGYQSKTYSLSDEVVAAIEEARAHGETPNQFLKRMLVHTSKEPRPLPSAEREPHTTYTSELVVELDKD